MTNEMPFIRWEEPPPPKPAGVGERHNRNWAKLAGFLSAHPGEWALVAEDLPPTGAWSNHLKHTYELEAAVRNQDNGLVRVYARCRT